jgi:hypothetical protein
MKTLDPADGHLVIDGMHRVSAVKGLLVDGVLFVRDGHHMVITTKARAYKCLITRYVQLKAVIYSNAMPMNLMLAMADRTSSLSYVPTLSIVESLLALKELMSK